MQGHIDAPGENSGREDRQERGEGTQGGEEDLESCQPLCLFVFSTRAGPASKLPRANAESRQWWEGVLRKVWGERAPSRGASRTGGV